MESENELNNSSSAESENNTVIESLKMYKALNKDLSNKVQDLKVEINTVNKENISLKAQLFEEKEKNASVKKYLSLINLHSSNFIHNYVTTVQQMAEEGIAVQVAAEFEEIGSQYNNLQINTRTINKQPARNLQQRLEENHETSPNNLLNTILEETRNESNSVLTSTPLQPSNSNMTIRNYLRRSMPSVSTIVDDDNDDSPNLPSMISNEISDRDLKEEESPSKDDCVENSLSDNEHGVTIRPLNEIDDTKADNSVTLKECLVVVSKYDVSDNSHNNLQEEESGDDNMLKPDNRRSKSRKRKSPENRNAQSRLKRKARPESSQLKEKSLKHKLRRS